MLKSRFEALLWFCIYIDIFSPRYEFQLQERQNLTPFISFCQHPYWRLTSLIYFLFFILVKLESELRRAVCVEMEEVEEVEVDGADDNNEVSEIIWKL